MCAHVRTCAMCVRKGIQNLCAMCVRAAVFWVCDVRSHFRTFWGKKGQFWTFFGNKRLISMLFSWSYFTLIPYDIKKCIKKSKICYKITHSLQTCVCDSNFGKTHTCVRCACGRKSSVRMCVRARQKIVATHSLKLGKL